MNTVTYVSLDYLDWSGFGGHHCQGWIKWPWELKREKVQLERRLTLREAKGMSTAKETLWLRARQRTTCDFESRQDLIRAAVKWCEANLTAPWILLNYNDDDLRRILGSKGVSLARIRVLNLIEEQWDCLTNAERDSDTMDTFYAMWREWKP